MAKRNFCGRRRRRAIDPSTDQLTVHQRVQWQIAPVRVLVSLPPTTNRHNKITDSNHKLFIGKEVEDTGDGSAKWNTEQLSKVNILVRLEAWKRVSIGVCEVKFTGGWVGLLRGRWRATQIDSIRLDVREFWHGTRYGMEMIVCPLLSTGRIESMINFGELLW